VKKIPDWLDWGGVSGMKGFDVFASLRLLAFASFEHSFLCPSGLVFFDFFWGCCEKLFFVDVC